MTCHSIYEKCYPPMNSRSAMVRFVDKSICRECSLGLVFSRFAAVVFTLWTSESGIDFLKGEGRGFVIFSQKGWSGRCLPRREQRAEWRGGRWP